jgi:hypothetical protein
LNRVPIEPASRNKLIRDGGDSPQVIGLIVKAMPETVASETVAWFRTLKMSQPNNNPRPSDRGLLCSL